jgi:hypothetical protein
VSQLFTYMKRKISAKFSGNNPLVAFDNGAITLKKGDHDKTTLTFDSNARKLFGLPLAIVTSEEEPEITETLNYVKPGSDHFIMCDQVVPSYFVDGAMRPVLQYFTLHDQIEPDKTLEFVFTDNYVPVTESTLLNQIQVAVYNNRFMPVEANYVNVFCVIHLRTIAARNNG